MNLDTFEDAIREAAERIPEIEDIDFDYDDYNAGEPFVHIHVSLKEGS